MGLTLRFVVALLAGPFAVPDYFLGQAVLVGIYVIAGVGLMLLAGYTGPISLGHAAFFSVGAYATAVLEKSLPFVLSFPAAGVIAGMVGVLIILMMIHGTSAPPMVTTGSRVNGATTPITMAK